MYVRSLAFQSGQSLFRYVSQASSKIQKYLPAESFTTHGEAIATSNTEVMSVLRYRAFYFFLAEGCGPIAPMNNTTEKSA